MTHKQSKPKAPDKNTVQLPAKPGQSRKAMLAQIAVDPCMAAAAVSTAYTASTFGEQGITETCHALEEQTARVHKGDMAEVESSLVAQAAALNSMFTNLARRAIGQEYLPQFQAHMKLALRAQNQCRMTLETLATIKNPPVVFAKQANMGQNVQVNNGTHARGNEKPQTEQLEAPHAKPEWMDAGATRTPAPSHQDVEALETIHRTKDKGRQGTSKP